MPVSVIVFIVLGFAAIALFAFWLGRYFARGSNSANLDEKLRELASIISKDLSERNQELGQKLFTWVGDESRKNREELQKGMLVLGESNLGQLKKMGDTSTNTLTQLNTDVGAKLKSMQEGNEKKLEQMRTTVDEKLNETLEKRLAQSFSKVGEMLSSLTEKFGEMKTLSANFQEVKNVFSNVKKRGVLGELQLENLLSDVLGSSQYKKNVATKANSNDKVEFVVVIPGENGEAYLPIDSKFPTTSYEEILAAQEQGDSKAMQSAQKRFITVVNAEAKKIREKYINSPTTTDYAILFLPSEALYAEAAQQSLTSGEDSPWRQYRVMIAGPSTLMAILTSFRMAFNMIKMTKHQGEAFRILGVLHTAFGKLSQSLAASEKQIEKAGDGLRDAQKVSKKIIKELNYAEGLDVSNRSMGAISNIPIQGDVEGKDAKLLFDN